MYKYRVQSSLSTRYRHIGCNQFVFIILTLCSFCFSRSSSRRRPPANTAIQSSPRSVVRFTVRRQRPKPKQYRMWANFPERPYP